MPSSKSRPAELRNYFWHCLIAAKLIDDSELELNAATRSNASHAIRKATACWDGREGVGHASPLAIAERRAKGVHWEKCGLIREHVIPVAVVTARVRAALEATRGQDAPPVEMSPADQSLLPADVIARFQTHPRAWQVAQQVRAWTLQAWITRADEDRLNDRARNGCDLTKAMPPSWDETQSRFARYEHCGVRLEPIT